MINLENGLLRKLQLIELELMIEVDRICRKYNINYSLDGGTLLGAIRHGGFIPWDDDADIMMSRQEYNRFYEACQIELDESKYFLQEFRTDKEYRWGYSKLRKNGTLFVREGQEHVKCHQGVCIDIFIFDNVPNGLIDRRLHLIKCFLIRKGLYSLVGKRNARSIISRMVYYMVSLIPRTFWVKWLMKIAQKENVRKTELMSHLTYPNRKKIRFGLSSTYYEEYIEKDFEGYQFKVIKNYDQYLKDLFDDYMQLPPLDKRKVHPASKIKL